MASSMLDTKILPSPMRPVWAARRMASIARSTRSSPILPPETLGLGHGNALQSDFLERFLNLVELEWLDDGFDLLH
jgi:hypothetical protein